MTTEELTESILKAWENRLGSTTNPALRREMASIAAAFAQVEITRLRVLIKDAIGPLGKLADGAGVDWVDVPEYLALREAVGE